MAHMLFGEFVVGQIDRVEAVFGKCPGKFQRFLALLRGHADEDMGLFGVRDAVIELGHAARSEQLAKTLEATPCFGDGDRKQGFAVFADFGALGDEAQAVEIHVRAAGDGDQGLAFAALLGHILLDRRHTQRARRLEDAAGVFKHILDRGADRIGVDDDEVIDQRLRDPESLLADPFDGRAVREQADITQQHAFARPHRAQHRIRIAGLHADHLDLGSYRLDVGCDARNQPAATDGDKDRVDRPLMLAQDLHCDRALAGDHVRVIKRVDEGQPELGLEFDRPAMGVGKAVAMQDDFAAKRLNGIDLQLGRGDRHHDDGAATKLLGRKRDALGMIAGRSADHAAGELLRAQVHHLVVSAAQFEAEDGLLVLALQ